MRMRTDESARLYALTSVQLGEFLSRHINLSLLEPKHRLIFSSKKARSERRLLCAMWRALAEWGWNSPGLLKKTDHVWERC